MVLHGEARRSAAVALIWPCVLALGCSLDKVDLASKTTCPCAPEYECIGGACRPRGTPSEVLGGSSDASTSATADPAARDTGSQPAPETITVPLDAGPLPGSGPAPALAVDAGPCAVLAPDAGPCPSACTGGCDAGVCTIECSLIKGCGFGVTTCPPGWPCSVACVGPAACSIPTEIRCADGPCEVLCTGERSCDGAILTCGSGPCRAECDAPVQIPLRIECGNSCECSGICG